MKKMAGRKIFVSYKYWDHNVEDLPGYSNGYPIARDYVDWIEKKFKERTDHIYKGEDNNEDLSDKSDTYIWNKLKDKIYDSSVTIVLISPGMKEANKWEKNQWIPWEISYSIKEMARGGYTSRSNAILAVILPDAKGSYDYYHGLRLFGILSDNIANGYIPVVKWGSFKYNTDTYIDKAIMAKQIVPSWKLRKTV